MGGGGVGLQSWCPFGAFDSSYSCISVNCGFIRIRDAETELLRSFPRNVVSLEWLMLHAMRNVNVSRKVQSPTALTGTALVSATRCAWLRRRLRPSPEPEN